jgi:hypothetical protein
MIRKTFLMGSILLVSLMAFAKDFHFVYVRLDNSMDKDNVKQQITKLKNSFANSDFVIFYSNGKMKMDNETYNERDLFHAISNQSSSVAVSVYDEFEELSNLLEKYLQLSITEDDAGFKRITSNLNYESISFDCVVGNEFFDSDYQNALLLKLLFANSLNQNNFNVDVFYYPCGAFYGNEITKFNPQYSFNKESIIVK